MIMEKSKNPSAKVEFKGKSWRREREERGRRHQKSESCNTNKNNTDAVDEKKSDVPHEDDHINDKNWGQGWNKSVSGNGDESRDIVQESKVGDAPVDNEVPTTESKDVADTTAEEQDKEEKKALANYRAECEERLKSKLELRERNQTQAANRPEESFFSRLDSSLKKNTAFIKKLRNLTEVQKDSLIKDFQTLNLTKYTSEAASAIVEAKLKLSDVNCAVTIASLLHQRYSDFASLLLENWQKVLPLKRDEKIINPSKVRVDLRFFAELISCGVFTEKEGLPILGNLLTVLTSSDKEEHKNSNIVLSFCKHCGDDYAGLVSRRLRTLSEKHGVELPKNYLLPAERQRGLKCLLKDYFRSICRHLQSSHKDIQNMKRQNQRLLKTKGELSNERKERFELMLEAHQKLISTTEIFSDLFDEEMPELPVDKDLDDEDESSIDIYNRFKDNESDTDSILFWEDEDTRSFYVSLPSLRAFIPGILFKDSLQSSENKTESSDDATLDTVDSTLEDDMSKLDLVDEMITIQDDDSVSKLDQLIEESVCSKDVDGKPTNVEVDIVNALIPDVDEPEDVDVEQVSNVSQSSANKILLDAFLSNLPKCVNREMIDKAATEFCMNLNTKPNRKKLIRSLFTVHRTRLDLLPFYSRLVATLHPCMPEISTDLCTLLKQDFKYHVRKKDQINIESKIKTVRFIGELVKFRIFPKSEALSCLKILLLDFNHHQIEMACNLLEACGQFLFRSVDSHQRTKVYLDQMMRKKSVMTLDSRYVTTIENAYYYCNPPDVAKFVKKERPPMHEYIRKLLYIDLAKNNVEKILRQIRKLNWDDEQTSTYIIKCFVHIWNVRFYNVRYIANLLAGLTMYRDNVAPKVVDCVLEDIRAGMEINQPKYNQRRVSSVKFLGELYNYRMVDSNVIFKALYSFITFGTYYDGIDSDLDSPDSLFRIRLVCVMLDTCGQYFNSGSSRKKLDFFLSYFQRYYLYKKNQPFYGDEHKFPITVDYSVKDAILNIRPKLKLHPNYEEACNSIKAMEQEVVSKLTDILPSLKTKLIDDTERAVNQLKSPNDADGLDTIQESVEEEDFAATEDEQPSIGDSDPDIDNMNSFCNDNYEDDEDTRSNSQSQDAKTHASGTQDTDRMYTSSEENDAGVIAGGPKRIHCAEDEDFMTALDKMLADNIQHRNQEVIKPQFVDISVPVLVKSNKKVTVQAPFESSSSPVSDSSIANVNETPKNTINFVLMTRKGNKQQYKSVDVPLNSELVTNLKDREKAAKEEKEKVKKLTLDINERQEEEDYQEMLAALQRPATVCNFNRERGKPKLYQHPKGAPDADLIFGNRKQL